MDAKLIAGVGLYVYIGLGVRVWGTMRQTSFLAAGGIPTFDTPRVFAVVSWIRIGANWHKIIFSGCRG